jgi:hypothetical protein
MNRSSHQPLRRSQGRATRVIALVTLCAIATAACTNGGTSSDATPSTVQPSDAPQSTASETITDTGVLRGPTQLTPDERWGLAPDPDDSVTLQPDVIIVGGGAQSIRSLAADGLTWTIDPDAEHADQLQIGSVMFLTGSAVGRVQRVTSSSNGLAVTLLPVGLGEIIRDGSFDLDAEIDSSAMVVRQTSDPTTAISDPGSLAASENDDAADASGSPPLDNAETPELPPSTDSASPSATTQASIVTDPGSGPGRSRPLAQQQPAPSPLPKEMPPISPSASGSYSVGGLSIAPSVTPDEIALTVTTNGNGLILGATVGIGTKALRAAGTLSIRNGKVSASDVVFRGIDSIRITFAGGAENGLADNIRTKVEVPFEVSAPVVVAGVPFVFSVKTKFLISTAFSAKNATLLAEGKYAINGPLIASATGEGPSISVTQSILRTLSGVSLGINGVVLAADFKFQVGLGVPVANAGPYVGITISAGLTNGSALGLVACRSASLKIDLSGGVGISVSSGAKAILSALGISPTSIGFDIGAKATVLSRTASLPNVPACRT